MKKLIKFLTKKNKGFSDLIASIIAIIAIITVAIMMVSFISDVYTRTQVDQVARKYIFYLESSNEKASDIKTKIRNELDHITSVQAAKALGATDAAITIDRNGSEDGYGYGKNCSLKIEVPVVNTNFFYTNGSGENVNGSFGMLRRNDVVTLTVTKQSTIKY